MSKEKKKILKALAKTILVMMFLVLYFICGYYFPCIFIGTFLMGTALYIFITFYSKEE